LVITNKLVYLVGREVIKKGPQKGQVVEVIKRKLEYDQIVSVSMRSASVLFSRVIPVSMSSVLFICCYGNELATF